MPSEEPRPYDRMTISPADDAHSIKENTNNTNCNGNDDEQHAIGDHAIVMMGRAPDCPMYQLNNDLRVLDEWNTLKQGDTHSTTTLVGMAVLLEHEPTGRVLITQRQSHMRSFKGEWVLPGGHFESTDASWRHAASREVLEEVGLKVDASRLQLFAAWESVFPTRLLIPNPTSDKNGNNDDEELMVQLPRRHHLVLYYYVKLHDGVQPPTLVLQPDEVQEALWLDRDQVIQELNSQRLIITQGTRYCLERWLQAKEDEKAQKQMTTTSKL